MKYYYSFAALLLLVSAGSVQAQNVQFFADARFGFMANESNLRDGRSDDDQYGEMRLRGGFEWTASDTITARVRLAGRYRDSDNSMRLRFQQELPGGSNLPAGYTTFDEAHVRARYGNWEHRVGRFQHSAMLAGVPAKSMSRTNSNNTYISWTDGVHSRFYADDGWEFNAIVHRNTSKGPTLVHRSPLGFQDSGSRATYYFSMENNDSEGTLLQRSVDVTFIPDSLRYISPSVVNETKHYFAVSGRVAVQQPLTQGRRLVLGAEAGYAPTTPSKGAVNVPGSGDASGSTWQISANLMDLMPGHSIGVVHGQTDAGWLLSTDFTNNQSLTEMRYAWRVEQDQTLHFRLRYREDLDRRVGALRRQGTTDMYLRYTINFN